MCLFLDRYPRHTAFGKWLDRQKVQGEAALTYLKDAQRGWDIVCVAAFNMLVIGPFIAEGEEALFDALYGDHRLSEQDQWHASRELPKLGISFWIVSVWFYWTHRMLHLPYFYKTIHKLHHSITAPSALAAVYAHPVEFLLANLAGVALGPILTNAHPYTAYLWYALAMSDTCRVHSGYAFLGAGRHDKHHHEFVCFNLATEGWIGSLVRERLEAVAGERNRGRWNKLSLRFCVCSSSVMHCRAVCQ